MASSKSSKRSSSLPFELVEEILSRIPVGSLVRFKSTCKQWHALLNKRFIYKHYFDVSREQFIQIYNDNKSVQLFNPETQAPSCLQGTPEIMRMIHCDGLLLCLCAESSKGCVTKKLAVWNPFLSRINWIEPPAYKNFDVFGFGYDNVSGDNYKILRFCDEERSDTEMYEFKSKLWRSVDAALDSSVDLWHPGLQALSMNGNMYWIALRKKSKSETEIFIQSFDFSSETFKDIGSVPFETDGVCRPRTGELVHSGFTLVLSGFGRERLSLLHQHRRVKIEVWVTNKVTNDGAVSWSKYFNVTRPDLPILHDPTSFCSFPTVIIDHKTNKIKVWCGQLDVRKTYIDVNVYEMGVDSGDIKKQVVEAGRHVSTYCLRNLCYVYVPSPVPVS